MLNAAGSSAAKSIIYIDAFFGDLLANAAARDSQYLATREIAKFALMQSGADGFFYPSVQDFNGMNLVMSPTAYAAQTNVVCCQFVRILKVREFGIFDYEVLEDATGVYGDGLISWEAPASQESIRFFGLTEEELALVRGHSQQNGSAYIDLVKFSRVDS